MSRRCDVVRLAASTSFPAGGSRGAALRSPAIRSESRRAVKDAPMQLTFVVPGQPIPKQRARAGKGGRHYTPIATRRYADAVRWAWLAQRLEQRAGWLLDQRYGITVTFYRQGQRRVDGDNLLKSVTDALRGMAYRDDSQIAEWSAVVHLGCDEPCARVVITRMTMKKDCEYPEQPGPHP